MKARFRKRVLAVAIMTVLSIQALGQTGMPQPIGGGRSFDDKEVGAYVYQFLENGGGYLVLQKAPKEVHLPYEWSAGGGMVYDGKKLGKLIPDPAIFVVIEKTASGFNVAEMRVDRQKLVTYLETAGKHYTIAELREYLRADSK
jgi:hypothetical protein